MGSAAAAEQGEARKLGAVRSRRLLGQLRAGTSSLRQVGLPSEGFRMGRIKHVVRKPPALLCRGRARAARLAARSTA